MTKELLEKLEKIWESQTQEQKDFWKTALVDDRIAINNFMTEILKEVVLEKGKDLTDEQISAITDETLAFFEGKVL